MKIWIFLKNFDSDQIFIILIDWLIYSYVVVTSNMSTSCECVYFFYIYRKTLRRIKIYMFIFSSIALRSSFDALSMLWTWCLTFSVVLLYLFLAVADLMQTFMSQCKLWQKFQFHYSSCELFEFFRRVNKIEIIYRIFFRFLFHFCCVVSMKELCASLFVFDVYRDMSTNWFLTLFDCIENLLILCFSCEFALLMHFSFL